MLELDALLLRGPEGAVRLLIAETTYLDVDERDLVDVQVQEPPADLRAGAAMRVRVVLARGCRLEAIGDGRSLAAQVWDRPLTFEAASRLGDTPRFSSSGFRAREAAYIAELDDFDRSAP